MRDLLDVQTAIKMLRREREKFPKQPLDSLILEYNLDWFDGILTREDLGRIESEYLKVYPE